MFALTSDQLAIRDMAKSFADERIAPNALRWDETEHFPVDVLREAAALGMATIYVREEQGGSRHDAARRHPHFRGAFDRLPLRRLVPLDPQHGGLGRRPVRLARSAAALPAPPF